VSPKAAKEEAQGFVDELFAIGTRQWSEMEASFTKVIRDRIHNLDIASKKRLYALTSKVGKLEKPIETLEQQISTEKESSCI
jgi:polyhydroxyalkanoate synthesis regulator phasin